MRQSHVRRAEDVQHIEYDGVLTSFDISDVLYVHIFKHKFKDVAVFVS